MEDSQTSPAAGSPNSRLHANVTGRVQGVGFRYFVQKKANELGVNGWVRNRWDGTVELTAEGERDALEQLLAAVRRGPSGARVLSLDEQWLPASGEFSGFRVKMTE
jgi:acylphosphatase